MNELREKIRKIVKNELLESKARDLVRVGTTTTSYDVILKKRIKRGLAKISTWNSSDDGDKQDKIERM